jgi:hypothetical protein
MRPREDRPGRTPEIVTTVTSVTFDLRISLGAGVGAMLVLRCTNDGEIYASIRSAPARE